MVQLIFRKKNDRSFSIEKVFDTVLPLLKQRARLAVQEVPVRAGGLKALLQNLLFLGKLKGDIFHITGDIHYAVFAFPRKRTLLTIHDCVFLETASGPKKWLLKKLWLDWPVRYVPLVTTISEKSKQEILANTNCPAEKIIVIPNAAPPGFYFREKPFHEARPVILFVGTKPNKNLPRAVKALTGIPCVLHIIGQLGEDQENELKTAGIDYRCFVNISDEEMAARYADCDMVLFPSLYEGFGLPVLEAQQSGRPIVTSNIFPMKEVAGDAACLVDPCNVEDIRAGVLKVINDKFYRETLVSAGLANVKRYRPEQVAEQYLELYKKIAPFATS